MQDIDLQQKEKNLHFDQVTCYCLKQKTSIENTGVNREIKINFYTHTADRISGINILM